MSDKDRTINYIELPATDLDATKAFYGEVFGWRFTDWGDKYISFDGAGIDGGFHTEDWADVTVPGIRVVIYADDLEAMYDTIKAEGAEIMKDIFDFPGGRRFHFKDPNGNELAVWSENAKDV